MGITGKEAKNIAKNKKRGVVEAKKVSYNKTKRDKPWILWCKYTYFGSGWGWIKKGKYKSFEEAERVMNESIRKWKDLCVYEIRNKDDGIPSLPE